MYHLGYPRLIDAAGKEPLGGGVSVGITATLQNAVVAFEGRPGPDWVLCTISGGNLVAVDENDAEIDPRQPTAFVTIDRTSSSSATLADISSLQAASFDGYVALDITSAYAGTTFPIGTRQAPVNNIADAIAISEGRGLTDILIMSSMTLDSGDFSDGYTFEGDNPVIVTLTIDPATDVQNCEFQRLTIEGTLDGANTFRDCTINDVTYTNGTIVECALEGTVTLGGGLQASFFSCVSNISGGGPGTYPSIDMGGAGQELVIRDFNGGIGIENCTGAGASSLDMSSGRVTFESNVTAGTFWVRGIADVTDDSTGTAVIHDQTISNTTSVTEAIVRNKTVTDPTTGVMTVYEEDGMTVKFVAQLYEGTDTAQTYQGQGAERRERLS